MDLSTIDVQTDGRRHATVSRRLADRYYRSHRSSSYKIRIIYAECNLIERHVRKSLYCLFVFCYAKRKLFINITHVLQ